MATLLLYTVAFGCYKTFQNTSQEAPTTTTTPHHFQQDSSSTSSTAWNTPRTSWRQTRPPRPYRRGRESPSTRPTTTKLTSTSTMSTNQRRGSEGLLWHPRGGHERLLPGREEDEEEEVDDELIYFASADLLCVCAIVQSRVAALPPFVVTSEFRLI